MNESYRVLERHPGYSYNGQSYWAHPEGLFLKLGEAIVVIDETALALIDADSGEREKVKELEETCKELGQAVALAIQQRNQARDALAKYKEKA